MKANLNTFKNPAMILAGLLVIGIGFSGCSPFRAARLDVDTVRIAQLRAEEAKKKAAEEKKRRDAEAARMAQQSSADQPAGEAQSELGQTTPAVEATPEAGPLDGTDGSAQIDPSSLSLEARDEAYAQRQAEAAAAVEEAAATSTELKALSEADTAFVTQAQELFSAKIVGENSVTPDEMVQALNLDSQLGHAIFAMSVTKAVETTGEGEAASIFSVNVEMAVRSIILEQVRASQFAAGYSLQNGTPIQVSPTYVATSGEDEAISPENIVIHSACVVDDCSKVVVYVEIMGVESTEPKQMAAFLFEDQDTDSKMKLIASSVGSDNVKDMSDEAVQAELVASEQVSADEIADPSSVSLEARDEAAALRAQEAAATAEQSTETTTETVAAPTEVTVTP